MGERAIRGPLQFANHTVVKVVTANSYQMTNEAIVVFNQTTGAAVTCNLPKSVRPGSTVMIKDGKGDANTNNITVQDPNSNNIDGSASYVMEVAYQSIILTWNGTQWNLIADRTEASADTITLLTVQSAANANLAVNAGGITSGTAGTLTLQAASVTGSTTGLTGGVATLAGGDNASTGATNTGGALTVRGGNASGAGATLNTGGNLVLQAGAATNSSGTNTHGNVLIKDGAGTTQITVFTGQITIAPAIIIESSVTTVAAAGNSQGTAATLTGASNNVTGANGTAGVIFPVPTAVGQLISIWNATSAQTLKVYPQSGTGTVNGGGAGAAATLAGLKGASYQCIATGPDQWVSLGN